MSHEPVSLLVEWLNDSSVSLAAPTITSLLDGSDPRPAVVVSRVTGGPLSDSSGVDTVYDWTFTLYVYAGKTGVGDYPDHQAAWSVVNAVFDAARVLPWGRFTSVTAAAGSAVIAAEVLSAERGVDEAGNARATLTLAVRTVD